MQSTYYNYKGARAAKARLGVKITNSVHVFLIMFVLLCILGGAALVVVHISWGWLVAALGALPFMVYEWDKGELDNPPVTTNAVDGLLSGDILGKLGSAPTPKQIATATASVRGGQFFAVRFGITAKFLDDVTSDNPEDTETIWKNALDIKTQTDSLSLNGAVMAVAILRSFADYESLLAHMHLDIEDLYAGVRWYNHLRQLVDQTKQPRRTGGIARDFSFGYTPMLKRFGLNLSEQAAGRLTVEIESHRKALNQLIDTFGTGGRQNAALIGQEGVGKTTIVHAFAEKLLDAKAKIPANLKFRQVIMLDSASLIAAAPGRGELEGLIMQVLGEAYTAKNIIICLDNAQLFFEEGIGSVDLTNVLLPILEAGNLRVILTMDEQRFLQIGQRNPALTNALNRISVAPAERL
ncbi:MAG: hypothetical protein JWO07_870, partial [Candidatus Saccharibacteria bacterium]|nr:hypothetical protein [Candidatus Saccharibacteria bacterium]